MMKRMLLVTLYALCNVVNASDFSWHGYVSQGVAQSSGSQFITDGNEITGELTEVGINGYYQLTENISVAGQVNYLDGGNRFEQGTRLDYLFIDWSLPTLPGNWKGQVHLGRFKIVIGSTLSRGMSHKRATLLYCLNPYTSMDSVMSRLAVMAYRQVFHILVEKVFGK